MCNIFLVLLVLVFPLFLNDGLFGIVNAKVSLHLIVAEFDEKLNNKFIEIARRQQFDVDYIINDDISVDYTIGIAKHMSNVINLRANFSQAINGTVLKENYLTMVMDVDDSYDNTRGELLGNDTVHVSIFIKLFATNLQKYPRLFDVIINFNANYVYAENNKVLICTDDTTNIMVKYTRFNKISSLIYFIFEDKECKNRIEELNDLTAVVMDKPIKDYRSDLPIIFYRKQFDDPEQLDMYPNSMNTINTTKYLELAITKFLLENNWMRVAILSDDDPQSYIFEMDLQRLFSEHNIVFIRKYCIGINCDFTEAIKELRSLNAKIIIANINIDHVRKLTFTAMVHGINTRRGHVWIFREKLSKKSSIEAYFNIGNFFSIYLTSEVKHCPKYMNTEQCEILKILTDINKAYKRFLLAPEEKDQYRYIATTLKGYMKQSLRGNIAYVTKFSYNQYQYILKMKMDNNIIVDSKVLSKAFDSSPPLDMVCHFRPTVFDKPCQDMYVVYIIFMIIVNMLLLCSLRKLTITFIGNNKENQKE